MSAGTTTPGADALARMAELLFAQGTLLSGEVGRAAEPAVLGPLAAAGPRAAADPGEYELVVELVREGYLLHYGSPRVLGCSDPDLALLAGDYLYAQGLERLAALGDLEAVGELADLISLCAQSHSRPDGSALACVLWLACVTAVGFGGSEEHRRAKEAARTAGPEAVELLWHAARQATVAAGVQSRFDLAAEAVGFPPPG